MTKSIMLALAASGALLCSANANAGGHASWSVGISAPAVGAVVSNGPAYGYGYPVYESYPVYAPAPVYVQPAPVYYGPAPAYYGPPAYYYRHHRHAYRPVVVAPYPRHYWR
jgi:hypothetical protein